MRYPTVVFQSKALSTEQGELWIKNDGCCDETYGGNKTRKLERIVRDALARNARRLFTMGAVGSHHVLATAVMARRHGLKSAALLFPHPWSQHAETNLRAALGQGLEPIPASTARGFVAGLGRIRRPADYVIAVGGLGRQGVRAYREACAELALQIQSGEAPAPDAIVVAVGTGTTAAGILAGLWETGLEARLIGVNTTANPISYAMVAALAQADRTLRGRPPLSWIRSRFTLDSAPGRAGYGIPTETSRRALSAGQRVGLVLDPTYTAKALGRALAEVRFDGFHPEDKKVPLVCPRRTLYWHTLSEVPLDRLLESAPLAADLNPTLAALFVRGTDP